VRASVPARAGRRPCRSDSCPLRSQRGQATVELLGAVPALLLLGLVSFQILAVGYAAVLAGNAAEAGALAAAGGADAREAARAAVPGWQRARMQVDVDTDRIRVHMRPPSPLNRVEKVLEVAASAEVVDR
jgi:Flp pilus assembly protein TadG